MSRYMQLRKRKDHFIFTIGEGSMRGFSAGHCRGGQLNFLHLCPWIGHASPANALFFSEWWHAVGALNSGLMFPADLWKASRIMNRCSQCFVLLLTLWVPSNQPGLDVDMLMLATALPARLYARLGAHFPGFLAAQCSLVIHANKGNSLRV